MLKTTLQDFQVVIIGGGPTGLAAALQLAQREIPVAIIEKKNWPVDKVCGEGLLSPGPEILRKLGVLKHFSIGNNQDLHYYPLKGLRYIDPSGIRAEAKFKTGLAMGIRRIHLSQALFKAMENNSFISLYPETELVNFEQQQNKVWVTVKDHHSKSQKVLGPFNFLLACDGIHSRVRRLSQLHGTVPGKQKRIGSRVHFLRKPWSDFVEVWWEKGIEAYVTPVSRDQIEVAFIWDQTQVKFPKNARHLEGLFSYFPQLQKRLSLASKVSTFSSIGPLAQRSKKIIHGQVIFLGDALLHLDGITGEGLTLGLIQGELFADLLVTTKAKGRVEGEIPSKFNPLLEFEKFTKIQLKNYLRVTHIALFLTRHSEIRRWIIYLFSHFPNLFQKLLGMVEKMRERGRSPN